MLVLCSIDIVQSTSPTATSPKHPVSLQFIKPLWHTVLCPARLGSSLCLHSISMKVFLGLRFFLAFLDSGEFSTGPVGLQDMEVVWEWVLHAWGCSCCLSHRNPHLGGFALRRSDRSRGMFGAISQHADEGVGIYNVNWLSTLPRWSLVILLGQSQQ